MWSVKCKNAEGANAANVIMLALLLTVSPWGVEPTANLLARGTEKFHAIGDSIPPKTLLKQEGFQLTESSFRDESTHSFNTS